MTDEEYIILKRMCADMVKKVNDHHERIKDLDKEISINFPSFKKHIADDEAMHKEIAGELRSLRENHIEIKEHIRNDDAFQRTLVQDIETIKQNLGVKETNRLWGWIKVIALYAGVVVGFLMTFQSYKDKVDLNKENIHSVATETKIMALSQAKMGENIRNIEMQQTEISKDVKSLLRKVDRIDR